VAKKQAEVEKERERIIQLTNDKMKQEKDEFV